MDTAVTVKLVRNLSMSILIPLMAILYRRGEQRTSGKKVNQRWHQVVPFFVVAFVIMACIRSLGDQGAATSKAFGLIDRPHWNQVGDTAKTTAPWLLATALGAVGLGTGLAKLKNLGLRPFLVGLSAALLVGVVSTLLIKILANHMH
jgi:uncharacterized membrane protein YadS